jgi:hypothetical protein
VGGQEHWKLWVTCKGRYWVRGITQLNTNKMIVANKPLPRGCVQRSAGRQAADGMGPDQNLAQHPLPVQLHQLQGPQE